VHKLNVQYTLYQCVPSRAGSRAGCLCQSPAIDCQPGSIVACTRNGGNWAPGGPAPSFQSQSHCASLPESLRSLLKTPTWCSASQLFVQHGAITFSAIIGKQQFSLLCSLCSCNHRLNGSSSPVLTATCLSYGRLCDFLGFFPEPTWRSHPSTDFDAK